MAQAVSRRPVTVVARVQSQDWSMWDLWWTKWYWDWFFQEYFGLPSSVSFHLCSFSRKNGKKLIVFITGLHNKPQGCGVSVALWVETGGQHHVPAALCSGKEPRLGECQKLSRRFGRRHARCDGVRRHQKSGQAGRSVNLNAESLFRKKGQTGWIRSAGIWRSRVG
jgi:hypothetical protein